MSDPTAWYDAHADELSDRYEAVPAERVHDWLKGLLPGAPATALDVGTGSGRDAAWLSRRGYDVVAAEPSSRFRTIARERHDPPPYSGSRTPCPISSGPSGPVSPST